MKKTLFSGLLAVGFGLVTAHASASDGTITFTGNIIDTNCTVTGGGNASGTGNITVVLPDVGTGAFKQVGDFAGQAPFSLTLGGGTQCTNGKTAALWIETSATPALDLSTGALRNQASGGATNVEVQMINPANNQKIDLGVNNKVTNGATVIAGSNQPAATIVGNTATLQYVAQYLSVGGLPTAGAVNTYLTYSMQYN